MGTRDRPADRGRRRGVHLVRHLGREIREARTDRSLSLEDTGIAVGLSAAAISRVERGLTPGVPLIRLASLCEVVGLALSARTFPGRQPLRDAAHVELLNQFRLLLHPRLRWATEVPLPGIRDQRSWDALVAGPGWRYGVEAETAPHDSQALARRLELKRRDGEVDGVILLVRSTRRTKAFLAEASPLLRPNFPVEGSRGLGLLAAGADPGGSAIIVLLTSNGSAPATRRFASGGR